MASGDVVTVNLSLLHDGTEWIAWNDRITAKGKDLEELDNDIKAKLKGILGKGKVKVTMELDYRRNVPHWIWQYHPYYFYRVIVLELD
jgi:hypothetical protein